ncbi:EGF-like repeat and discoidin I-like domain-containing 3, partial [Paramuricea clavata]
QPCAEEPCKNEGKCSDVGGNVSCSCLAGYYGDRCEQKECKQPLRLGVENGEIPDSQILASSEYDANHGAVNSRLNFRAQGRRQGAWSSRRNDLNQWLQVNFVRQATVNEILTQGRSNADQCVTSYSVSYSNDGLNFFAYRVNGVVKVFRGNRDRSIVVRQSVSPVIVTKYIRIHPKQWHGHISMRAQGKRQGAWSARRNDLNQWLQVNFVLQATVTEILTQGRSNADQWVTSYTVSYSNDGLNFFAYRVNGVVKVFLGNRDRSTVVRQSVSPVIVTKYIRIHPKQWHGHISMRVGFRGCLKGNL